MNVISSTTIKRYAALHADAAEELLRWNKAASHAVWRDVNEVRLHFPDAGQFKPLLIFNIRHNYYRLIVKVDYRARLWTVKEFLTHKEYTRGCWKEWARVIDSKKYARVLAKCMPSSLPSFSRCRRTSSSDPVTPQRWSLRFARVR